MKPPAGAQALPCVACKQKRSLNSIFRFINQRSADRACLPRTRVLQPRSPYPTRDLGATNPPRIRRCRHRHRRRHTPTGGARLGRDVDVSVGRGANWQDNGPRAAAAGGRGVSAGGIALCGCHLLQQPRRGHVRLPVRNRAKRRRPGVPRGAGQQVLVPGDRVYHRRHGVRVSADTVSSPTTQTLCCSLCTYLGLRVLPRKLPAGPYGWLHYR